MLTGLIVLLLCQLAGEVVVRALGVPVPGPVVGLVLLFVVLQVRRPQPQAGVVRSSEALLGYLPLLFVPAGVGVVAYLSRLGAEAVPIAGGLVLSWLAGLVATAGVAALLLRLTGAGSVRR